MTREDSPVKVFVSDNQVAIREGIKVMLERENIEVTGHAGTIEHLIKCARKKTADVFIVGLNANGLDDLAIIGRLRDTNADIKIVAYCAEDAIPLVISTYQAGAKGYVTKNSKPEELIKSIQTVANNNVYFMPGIAEKIALYHINPDNPRLLLSDTELKIFIMLAEGKNNLEVAQTMGVGERSIANRATTIRHKLRIERTDFTLTALKYHLIDSTKAEQ